MAKDIPRPEGPADVGEPADEGGKVNPDERPSRRNVSDRLPGEANEALASDPDQKERPEQERQATKRQVRQRSKSEARPNQP
jgi:hypothetical protein